MFQNWIFSFVLLVFISHVKSAPNIIFILFDDVGWADFNYNVNGHSAIPTPNLDELAAKGNDFWPFFQTYFGKKYIDGKGNIPVAHLRTSCKSMYQI
jgi:hypothetical protein